MPINFAKKSNASDPPDEEYNDISKLEDASGRLSEMDGEDKVEWPRKIVMDSSEGDPDEIEDSAASDFSQVK